MLYFSTRKIMLHSLKSNQMFEFKTNMHFALFIYFRNTMNYSFYIFQKHNAAFHLPFLSENIPLQDCFGGTASLLVMWYLLTHLNHYLCGCKCAHVLLVTRIGSICSENPRILSFKHHLISFIGFPDKFHRAR